MHWVSAATRSSMLSFERLKIDSFYRPVLECKVYLPEKLDLLQMDRNDGPGFFPNVMALCLVYDPGGCYPFLGLSYIIQLNESRNVSF